jgi:uncharacterized protein (TIGR03067 family)
MKRHLLVLLAVGVLLGAGNAQEDAGKQELARIQGTWTYVSFEEDGKPLPPEQLSAMTITFAGDRYVVTQGDKVLRAGTHRFDPTKTPKAVDATLKEGPGKGTTQLGIYELTADTLKVCYSTTGKDRPTEFKTASGSNRYLAVVRRAKK